MSQDNWHSKMLKATALPIGGVGNEQFADQNDSVYILELFELNFKQFSSGAYVLRLSFFNFPSRRFFGSLKQISCNCFSSAITLNVTFHFRAFSCKSAFLVLELADKDGASICWTTMPVFQVSQIAANSVPSVGDNQLRQSFPLFAGSCRTLLFADSLSQLVPHLQRLNAALSASLRLSSDRPAFSLPEFLLFHRSSSFKLFEEADQSALTFTSILDNLALSYGTHSDLSDAIILDVLSREQCYGWNQPQSKASHRLRVMERRLKVATHNGFGFVEEPLSVLLHSSASPSAAAFGDPFRHRSQSLGRRDGTNFGSFDFCARNSVRLRHLSAADPLTAIVFVLEYLVASRAEANDILLDARIVRVGWAAWTPSPRGTISLADTITLELLGGPRPSPFDGFCLRDLSHSAFVHHSPNVRRDFPSSFPSCAKIEIRFNFVPLMEGDHFGRLSLLSSQQTPLPRPDLRPRSSAAVHQVEDVQLAPLSLVAQINNNTSAPHNLTSAEESEREDELLSPAGEEKKDEMVTSRRTTAGRHSSVSMLETKQHAIEVELPSARVSAFPRRVSRQFIQCPFPTLTESVEFTHIDPMEKREIRTELERIDKFGASEVSFQFMAFKRLGSLNTFPSSHQLFFSFQFFSFEPIITESLFLNPESAGTNDEQPLVLRRNGAEEENVPGLIVRFVVGTQKKEFLRYLLEENVHIHIWETDSLFYVGSTSVPLKCLLRQGSSAVLSSVQAPVLQSAFLPSVGMNQLAGLLYFRMANVGKNVTKEQMRRRSLINYGERAQSLRSADGANPLERFLAFQRIDMEQRSLRIFGRDEERRVREWAKLRGGADGPPGRVASDGAAKFLFSEELATYRALRREGKALALLRTVFSSVTTSLRAEAIGGQLVHLQFQLRNPFPEDCICSMEVNEPRLSPVISKEELEFLRQKHQQRHIGRCLFEWEEQGTNAWTTLLRGMERVQVALRFDTGTDEKGWAPHNTKARAFFRRLPQGNPLAILEVAVSVSRPFLSQHFQWFAEEGRKLVRAVPVSRAPLPQVFSVRVSDPTVLCTLQPSHSFTDGIQRLRIECLSRGLSDVRHFLVFLYSDHFHSELLAVQRLSVHSMGRLHSSGVQGQQIRVQLGGFGHPSPGELVRLFCSSSEPSSSVGLLPSSSFASSALSLAQMSVHFRPSFLGICHLLIGAIATSTCEMLGQWLLSVTVDEPNIAKVFEVTVPRATEGLVRKRIPLHNPLGISRQFRLVSSDPLLLSLPTPLPPPVPPHSSIPLPLIIHCPVQISRPCTPQTLLFVEDVQTGAQEETYAVRVRFE